MKKLILLVILVAFVFVLYDGLFVIHEGEQAIVTRFGKPVGKDIKAAGLNFKLPFIEDVRVFEKRILKWDGDPNQIPTKDKKYIWVDATARWRISDPLKFFKTVATVRGAQSRLDDIIDSVIRDSISGNYLVDLVRGPFYKPEETDEILIEEFTEEDTGKRTREEILAEIIKIAKSNVPEYGIELIDVQIKRLNYVEMVLEKVYERMISERNKVAAAYRSEGEGTKAEIIGEMSKELKRLQSEAFRTAEEIRGKADAKAALIYAEAYNRNSEFYSFFRSMEALEKSVFKNGRLVVSTDSELFKYLKTSTEKID